MFNKVLIINRGDSASRVIRTLNKMKIASVVVYSEIDADLPYIKEATESYAIGPSPAQKSYLNQDVLLDVLQKSGADAVHPGFGFLSENADFAQKVENTGAKFIGPSPKWLSKMANKNVARAIMSKYGLPIGKGSGKLSDNPDEIKKAGRDIGFPVLVKPAGGGGGIGMLPAYNEEELLKVVQEARTMAQRAFDDGELYLEKYFEKPRHIEFQVLADQHGHVTHFFERDCSIQRRHQKLIEESPAVGLDRNEINQLADKITEILADIGYDNIGTVEMLRDSQGHYSFLEMNTRLQVEHGVSEEINGIDLVEAQIRCAAGEQLETIVDNQKAPNGHAIEVRIYAEDPKTFFPSPGKLLKFSAPTIDGIRIETGFAQGTTVSPFYDPMVAKVIAHAETRQEAIAKLLIALKHFEIVGIKTNIPFLIDVLNSDKYQLGQLDTGFVKEFLNTIGEKHAHS
ncbi:acetyl-CoA carboxylase biotin carboxylase subunit [Leuconostoc miyukkimchii]|uniref:acetyl-CoA carboxylase biotin carboxylase subunit n=1 Tax=Leuconostoc miyukkimchii TaxID=910540 RepID=UPI001C7CA6F5|nr:biotin carboxylase N-terminal domain-containing protein [Leuconostoc miyukkimchii]